MSEEVKPEVIEKTQKILGKHISKPVLTEKLLRKPPFRFLHDVVTAVIKDTGFLNGLFTETELVSDNVKERDTKIVFLTKLIEAVKTLTEIDLKVKPTKIIAGLEPSETNTLLQAIGYAVDKKIDSKEYIKNINKTSKLPDKTKKTSKKGSVKNEKIKGSMREKQPESEITKSEIMKKSNLEGKVSENIKRKGKQNDHRKEGEKKKISPTVQKEMQTRKADKKHLSDNKNIKNSNLEKVIKKTKSEVDREKVQETDFVKPKEDIPEKNYIADINTKQEERKEDIDDKTTVQSTDKDLSHESETVEYEQPRVRSARPKSARPQTGDKKIAPAIIEKTEENISSRMNQVNSTNSLRPPSVRPPSARPGAPRLRPDSALPLQEIIPLGKIKVIVENYNTKEVDEEETVVIQNAGVVPEPIQKVLDIPEDKGHLVEQILEQIHGDDVIEHVKNKNEINWESEGFHNRDNVSREINQLKSQIQSLTKVANPLGKLMNYLHEDIESMLSELNMWVNMKKELYKDINKQQRSNEDLSKPLIVHLEELEENIKKQEHEIINIRCNIFKNDVRIRDLLKK